MVGARKKRKLAIYMESRLITARTVSIVKTELGYKMRMRAGRRRECELLLLSDGFKRRTAFR
jgi:hypothetical protein